MKDFELLEEVMDLRERAENTEDAEELSRIRAVAVQGLIQDEQDFEECYEKRHLENAKLAAARMIYRSRLLGFICTKQPAT